MRFAVVLIWCLALGNYCHAQDSTSGTTTDTLLLKKPHSAKKATILSALVPGAGQIYNKKYWKAPLAWGGMATCIYFISDNRKFVNLYKGELVNIESDPTYVSIVTDNLGNPADATSLELNLDKRKRWLDLSFFALFGVYGLNIIDANVDGHLFDYDISPDISLRVAPSTIFSQSPKAGLSLTLNF